ncbi:hypothetical protein OROMI_020640 [Orobanche minor]
MGWRSLATAAVAILLVSREYELIAAEQGGHDWGFPVSAEIKSMNGPKL